jgi:phage head maturation protease
VSDQCIQGVATEFNRVLQHGDGLLYLQAGCFDESMRSNSVKLLMDHDENKQLSKDLEVYAGKSALIFRFPIPSKSRDILSDFADEPDSYWPVSIGMADIKTEQVTVDGTPVTVVVEATLTEISLLSSGSPAVKSTFARVASLETCDDLRDDYERFKTYGAFVSLHRKFKSSENDGVVKYHHSPTSYDRAASRFERALMNL